MGAVVPKTWLAPVPRCPRSVQSEDEECTHPAYAVCTFRTETDAPEGRASPQATCIRRTSFTEYHGYRRELQLPAGARPTGAHATITIGMEEESCGRAATVSRTANREA